MMGSVLARAWMQLRTSPGGGMPRSWRSMPLPPPSSATVTMAVMLRESFFRPRSMVESPVPPPITAIRGSCKRSVFMCHPFSMSRKAAVTNSRRSASLVARALATATLRWRPPVQPTAMCRV